MLPDSNHIFPLATGAEPEPTRRLGFFAKRSALRNIVPVLLALLITLLFTHHSSAATSPALDRLGALALQDGGRVMPLDSYARGLAAQLTGREHWSADEGPQGFTRLPPMILLLDALFRGPEMLQRKIIGIENVPFKQLTNLDPDRRFFSAAEIGMNPRINELLAAFGKAIEADSAAKPSPDQKRALDLRDAVEHLLSLNHGQPLAIVPMPRGQAYLKAGLSQGDAGTETVQQALRALASAYSTGANLDPPADALASAIRQLGDLDPADARSARLELFYNHHQPWRMTAYAYALSLILFGLSRLAQRRPLTIAATIAAAWGVGEHLLGLALRIAILERAPVSNTYESLLWMGLVAIAMSLVAQAFNRKAWYFVAGLAVALLSVLFSNLVPLESRTGSLPAVLRSNYWLIVHVLTIVASYGVLAVGAILGHLYLIKEALLASPASAAQPPSRFAHPLVVQVYRSLQLGLFLLTAGTILGGVWAADSWGRFWGWDPKETWALISIVVYFIVLHARYINWIKDFGLAASAVLGFAAIVWTFYGVNYLMGAGLHTYGFGAGGGTWVGVWALAECAFVALCRLRLRSARLRRPGKTSPIHA